MTSLGCDFTINLSDFDHPQAPGETKTIIGKKKLSGKHCPGVFLF
jgi:hypothetical protein